MATIKTALPESILATEMEQTVDTTQAFTDLLTQTQRVIRRRKCWFWAAGAAYFSLQFSPGVTTWFSHWLGTPILSGLGFALTFLAVGCFYLRMTFAPVKFDANALAQLGGKNAIPALVEFLLKNTWQSNKEDCVQALILLLPQLQATDAHLLVPRHKRALNALIKHNPALSPKWYKSEELIVATLKAYEQVGTEEDIAVVERLANREANSECQKRIQEAAIACLPLLRAHVNSLGVTQTLLRASAPDTAAPDILLRSATSTTNTPEEELLRAGDSKDVPTVVSHK